ncbi:MAG TPA: N-acetylmuramoyl-L-alanine amidase [Longimicrobium sp.]|jgi:SH3-like domain-containing protein|uniref:N-acetylmuramoyl-L-alanine amidase n=1 Tax=Longimicrobium sp. TaxID=2029185 RepID=UPI002ED85B5B
MKTQGQFTLFETLDEFAQFIQKPVQRQIKLIQNHHTAEPSYNDFNGQNHFQQLKGMKSFHVNERKFSDIAQNLTTFPDGTIAICRPMDQNPAGIKGANTGAICIEHVGNFDNGKDKMTAAQRECIIRMNALLARRFKLKLDTNAFVYHHWYDLDSGTRKNGAGNTKTCPGTNFFGGNTVAACQASFLPLIQAAVAALDGTAPAPAPVAVPTPGTVSIPIAVVATQGAALSIRRGPDANADKLGELADGSVVHIHEANGIWRRIDPVAQKWVSSKYLAPAPQAVSIPIAVVSTQGGALSIRRGPDANADKLGELADGSIVHIHEANGIWRRIDPVEQKWVSGKFLAPR